MPSEEHATRPGYRYGSRSRSRSPRREDPRDKFKSSKVGIRLQSLLPPELRQRTIGREREDPIKLCRSLRGSRWPDLNVPGGGAAVETTVQELSRLSDLLLEVLRQRDNDTKKQPSGPYDLTNIFAAENGLGRESTEALRALPPGANLRAIGAGAISGHDRVAVLTARIRRAQDYGADSEHFDAAREIAAFVEKNWVSADLDMRLRAATPEVQRTVVREGPLLGGDTSKQLRARLDKAEGAAKARAEEAEEARKTAELARRQHEQQARADALRQQQQPAPHQQRPHQSPQPQPHFMKQQQDALAASHYAANHAAYMAQLQNQYSVMVQASVGMQQLRRPVPPPPPARGMPFALGGFS